MLPVSQSWRDAITEHRTKYIRGAMKASVYLGAFDETASSDASLSGNVGEMYYSDFDNVNSSESQECSYATWEEDSFRGDGVQYLVPKPTGAFLRQGWVSSEMSASDGSFATNPTITIEFSEPHSMIGLTILFDPYVVATDFTITQYNNGSVIGTDSFSGNTDYLWTEELSIEDADKIVIEFTGANPYQRIHIQHILFGIGYTYDSNDLIDLSLVRENNPLSLSLPNTALTFSLFNENGKFNVDKDDSLIRFLREDQKVIATMWFDVSSVADNISGSLFTFNPDTGELSFSSTEFYSGLEIQNGYLVHNGKGNLYLKDGFLYGDNSDPVWEQLKLCTLWLKSWDVKGVTATFKCEDAIHRLNNIEYNDSDFGNTALDTRLDAIMSYSGYSNYEFAMNNQPCLVMPKLSAAQLLQLSANITMSTLEQDADAKIIIRPRTEPVISSVVAHGTTEPWSVVSSIGLSENKTYAILEANFFTGDGSQILMGTPYEDNGITWDEFPVGGDYSNAICDIILTENATFGSLKVEFPQPFIPTKYIVRGYRYENGSYSQVYEREVDGYTTNIVDVFDRIQKLEITIDGCEENQRARLKTVALGWSTGYDIVSADIIDRPQGKILTSCRNVIADKRTYTGESSQIASVDCEAGVDTDISYNEPCTGITAVADTGTVTIVESHAYHTIVRTTDDAKVTLSGVKQTENTTQETEAVNLHGEDLEINNPLISTLPVNYMAWAKAYAERNTEYQFETLGFPELEAADLIYYKGESAQIIKHVLNFNSGACRSQFIVRKE